MSPSLETTVAVLAEQIKADRHEREAFRRDLRDTLGEIRDQVTRTNGRVSRLEQWRWFLLGGFAALSAPWAFKAATLLGGS